MLNTKLDLEMKAFHALADSHKKGVVGWLSVHACALMMAEASSDCLTSSKDRESGNVDHLVIALKEAGLELAARIDGEQFKGTSENIVLCVAYSLEQALNARPPQEVVEAVRREEERIEAERRRDPRYRVQQQQQPSGGFGQPRYRPRTY